MSTIDLTTIVAAMREEAKIMEMILDHKESRIAELKAALRPFADEARRLDGAIGNDRSVFSGITAGHLRAAYDALDE